MCVQGIVRGTHGRRSQHQELSQATRTSANVQLSISSVMAAAKKKYIKQAGKKREQVLECQELRTSSSNYDELNKK